MKIWTTPKGEKLTLTEFMTRWKEGTKQAVLTMSPQSQNDSQIKFSWIVVIGLICGIIVSILNLDKFWWVGIVLFAALGNTLIQLVGLYQKRNAYKKFILFTEGGNNE